MTQSRLRAIAFATVAAFLVVPPLQSVPSGQQLTGQSTSALTFSFGARGVAKGRLLAINDFHGALEPPVGAVGLVNGVPAGGVEYLATWLERLRAEARAGDEDVLTVGAGDMVGASPLLSAAFHDEPTVELLSELGLDMTAVGNHELDEGVAELLRLQRGGCHPVDGCQDGDGFAGAAYRHLAANVVYRRTGLPILLPVEIRFIQGVPIGIVGISLPDTARIVNPAGISNITFLGEVDTANFYAAALRFIGIRSLVLLIHDGGLQNPPPPVQDPSGCANFIGPIASVVAGLRPEYGIVVSGHTHRSYVCSLPNSSGNTLVTSAGANGMLVTSIGFTLDRRTRTFTSMSAENVIVENGVRLPDGTWARDAAGNFLRNPGLVDPEAKVLLDKYRVAIAPLANRIVGQITADIVNFGGSSGESPMGDVIADAQLAYTVSEGAQIALTNPGGIRNSLSFAQSSGGEPPGAVTYAEAFAVQPFNNLVVIQTFTGAQLKDVLEQQFVGFGGQTVTRILQVSAGFTYTYDSTRALGSRVSAMALNGVPIDPAATYRVATNDFLANGGDGFTLLTGGTNRTTAPAFDIDALVAYLGGAPVAPPPANRITRIA